MNSRPAISVLMPAHNAEAFIGEAIASVLQQSFTDFELIIINDGSTDNTESVVRNFNDSRIKLFSQQNKGISAALNYGLEKASAPLVARFDADDICYLQRLSRQYELMQSDTGIVITGSAVDYIDAGGQFIFSFIPGCLSDEEIRKQILKNCPFIHSSVMYRKAPVMQLGGYHTESKTFEDHFLWTQLLEKGKGCNLKEPLIQVRLNPQSITIDEKWRPNKFRQIKRKALAEGKITEDDARRLTSILSKQDSPKIKHGAYYSMLAKKFLWNNYKPADVRSNLKQSLSLNKFHLPNYFLYLLSYLPPLAIQKIYRAYKTMEDKW